MAALHTLKRMTKRAYRRVGRGQSSTRGKQSGRGGKGQTARAGNKKRPELRDIIKKIPKRRGYGKNRGRTVWAKKPRPFTVTLSQIESIFPTGAEISPKAIVASGIFSSTKKRLPMIKIVGSEGITKKFTVVHAQVSSGAKSAIEKAGGTVA